MDTETVPSGLGDEGRGGGLERITRPRGTVSSTSMIVSGVRQAIRVLAKREVELHALAAFACREVSRKPRG